MTNRLKLQELQDQQKEKEETQLDVKAYDQLRHIQIEKFWGKEESLAHQQAASAIEVDYIQSEERNKTTPKTIYEKETTDTESEKKRPINKPKLTPEDSSASLSSTIETVDLTGDTTPELDNSTSSQNTSTDQGPQQLDGAADEVIGSIQLPSEGTSGKEPKTIAVLERLLANSPLITEQLTRQVKADIKNQLKKDRRNLIQEVSKLMKQNGKTQTGNVESQINEFMKTLGITAAGAAPEGKL